jgi:exopolysaccharide biosynthesis protein
MTPANWPVSAMNLDGGGSTAMAVNGTLVNHTSDQTGERPDGDFVVAIPRLRPAG